MVKNASKTDFGTDKERGIAHYISDLVDPFLRYRSGTCTPHIQSAWLMCLPHVKNYCVLLFLDPDPRKVAHHQFCCTLSLLLHRIML
jgi:hypothetical protein